MGGIRKQVYVEDQAKFTKTYDKAGRHDTERDKGMRNWDREKQNRRREEDSESRCVHQPFCANHSRLSLRHGCMQGGHVSSYTVATSHALL